MQEYPHLHPERQTLRKGPNLPYSARKRAGWGYPTTQTMGTSYEH